MMAHIVRLDLKPSSSTAMNRLNLQRFGNGKEKIVAIHGLGSAGTVWELIKPNLVETYEFITLDLPGHGESELEPFNHMSPKVLAELIFVELVESGISKFHVVGNSLGGWVALEMAALFPENVQSVTALAPAGFWQDSKFANTKDISRARFVARYAYKLAPLLLPINFFDWLFYKNISPRWSEIPLQTKLDAAIAMGRAHGYSNIRDAFTGTKFEGNIQSSIPITIVFGDTDKTLPAPGCQDRSLAPEHASWRVFKKTGHAPMWDQIETTIKVIKETIDGAHSPIAS